MNSNWNEHIGIKILLIVGLVSGFCLSAADYVSQEAKIPKYDLSVRPGAVTYGTRSTAAVPMVSVSTPRSSMPMISGGAVRSYAYSGHATMPHASSAGSGFKMYTTSSASVHAIGGGGSGGGGGATGGSRSSSSSNLQYGGGFATVSMPALALTSSSSGSATAAEPAATPASELAETSVRTSIGPRRVIDNGDGSYTGEYDGEYYDGLYWNEKEEEWQSDPPVGTIKEEGGFVYEWNGSAWVLKGQVEDLGTPIGSTPWLLLLLLSLAYGVTKKVIIRKAGWTDNKE